MKTAAIIVTRGDHDLTPCLRTIPDDWQKVVWKNGISLESWGPEGHMQDAGELLLGGRGTAFPDLAVYGRYRAILHTNYNMIYVQDDDVVVSDPQAIVDEWHRQMEMKWVGGIVANMPAEFRHEGYVDSCLVGFGAVFARDVPARAFERFQAAYRPDVLGGFRQWSQVPWFQRTCDVLVTALSSRVLIDVPKTNLPWATDESRMYRTPGHVEERARMLELARRCRDA